tara:strand:+ start:2767 stop:2961 length:195 start_codon:yes stop_codon:yes gene_type:complete
MTPQDLLNQTLTKIEEDKLKRNLLSQKIQEIQNEFNQIALNINANERVVELLQTVDGVELPETA